jgi:murein L,D-transpeptidase YafK
MMLAAMPAYAFDPLHVPGFADRVVVKKAERKLFLYRNGTPIGVFPVALGKNPLGHKQQQGDSRTPEGRYLLDVRKADSKFYRALHVSYPNWQDQRGAQERGVDPGGDIMVHGLPNWYRGEDKFFSFGDWTDGCIALGNRHMDVVWDSVPAGTPIDILP